MTTAYVSTFAAPPTDGELDALLEVSRRNNARTGITGMLMLRGRRAMQFLEGDEPAVRDLLQRISVDPRHADIVTVWSGAHDQRRFPDWTMKLEDLDARVEVPMDVNWLEPNLSVEPSAGQRLDLPDETADFLQRRARVLRRGLASGERLVTSLTIILQGHRPEHVLDGSTVRMQCAECRASANPASASYPCSTARNATWALQAAFV